MKNCPLCGADLKGAERFCPLCGARLSALNPVEASPVEATPETPTPAEPVYQPVMDTPAEPVYTPAAETPAEPVYAPAAETPAEPVYAPAAETPAEPVSVPATETPTAGFAPTATAEPTGQAAAGFQQTPPTGDGFYAQPTPPTGDEDFTMGSPLWQQFFALLGSNQSYYLNQFQQLKNQGTTRFNWAVFFFGPYVTLYRKCYRFYCSYYLGPMLLTLLSLALTLASVSQHSQAMQLTGSLLSMAGSTWTLVASILAGKRFNGRYFQHLNALRQQQPFQSHRGGVSLLGPILLAVVLLLSGIGASFATFSNIRNSLSYSPYSGIGPSVSSQYSEGYGYYLLPDEQMMLSFTDDSQVVLTQYYTRTYYLPVEYGDVTETAVTLGLYVPQEYWHELDIDDEDEAYTELRFALSDGTVTGLAVNGMDRYFYTTSQDEFDRTLNEHLDDFIDSAVNTGYYAIEGEGVYSEPDRSTYLGELAQSGTYDVEDWTMDGQGNLWMLIYSTYSQQSVWVLPY